MQARIVVISSKPNEFSYTIVKNSKGANFWKNPISLHCNFIRRLSMLKTLIIGVTGLVIVGSVILWQGWAGNKVDYNTEVKPILNKHCMGCHGGVKKAGDVSFLFEEEMLKPGKSGKIPVVRGDVAASEVIRRIESHDSDERMPKNAPPLTEKDINTLKEWINQGAEWKQHWAYRPVEKPEAPSLNGLSNLFGLFRSSDQKWAKNEIDHFVLKKLKAENLSHSPEADKATLIRRVSLDLIGLPPTEKEVRDFVDDKSTNAFEKVVDKLLKSPDYGERWTSMWLDLARYADSKGYEKDRGRTMWRYRDYVIKSFNDDKPFDQFTIEQLAGDLIQNKADGFPKQENLIATGFHRNTMNNEEGGTNDEEYRNVALIDRVNTTWEVWQGTTFGCIQCHSHPYDPIPHDDYYKYLAFFNNTRDEDVSDDFPKLRLYKGEDSVKTETVRNWITKHNADEVPEFYRFMKVMEPKVLGHSFVKGPKTTDGGVSYGVGGMDSASAKIPMFDLTNKTRMVLSVSGTNGKEKKTKLTFHLDKLDGKILAQLAIPERDSIMIIPMVPTAGKHELYVKYSRPENPAANIWLYWVAFQKPIPGDKDPGFETIETDYATLINTRPEEMPVFWEGTEDFARKTHVFVRGNWMVKGAEVKPDVPKMLGGIPKEYPRNRLGLSKWIVSRKNPLTARVIVNRFWAQLFGRGIVETVEDFGSQGSEPSNQELLDWLAVRFMDDYKWSLKKLLKEIVMSATYQQSSVSDDYKQERDPYNIYLSRGPRVRLGAEQIRDQALKSSGLLSKKMYGPSVMPPQPDRVWQAPYSGEKWISSEGEDRYRRGVYTYWKRTSPYPSMVAFDAPSREFCVSRRIVTNTPLQALVTLNDPVYMEAAENLAIQMQHHSRKPAEQLQAGYKILTYKDITPKDLAVLLGVYNKTLNIYRVNQSMADSLLIYKKGKSPELAALTVSANVLLNLDNVVTKE